MRILLSLNISCLLALALLALSGCAKNGAAPAREAGAANSQALPASWVELSRSGVAASNLDLSPDTPDEPGEATSRSVRAMLKAHTDALTDVLTSAKDAPAGPVPASHPKDWAPWHLDGMIAEFGLTVDGLFGALLGEGAAALKITWQRQKEQPAEPARKAPAKKASVQVSAAMTPAELSRQLEPSVRAAVSAGSVKDEATFRKNLGRQALSFLSLSRVLSKVRPYKGWAVDGYQLQLTFDALGQVTPVVAAGGSVVIVLNWARPDSDSDSDNDGPSVVLSDREAQMLSSTTSLTESIAPTLAQDSREKRELKKKGFVLDEVHVGLGFSVGGDVGIAVADAQAFGKLNFKKIDDAPAAEAEPSGAENDATVNVITSEPGSPLLQSAGSFRKGGEEDHHGLRRVFKLKRDRFRRGLDHALHMASYFVKHTHETSTSSWKVVEIEAGFAMSVEGDIRLVTAAGTAQVELAFHPAGE